MELKKIKDIVAGLLKENEVLRGNDDLLYLATCAKVYSKNDDLIDLSIGTFFKIRKELGLPSFESVRRTRQKAQEENPALKPKIEIQKARKENEKKFYKFATKQGELF